MTTRKPAIHNACRPCQGLGSVIVRVGVHDDETDCPTCHGTGINNHERSER